MSLASRRVLFVSGEYPPMHGGIGDYSERLVCALQQVGWDAAILTSRTAGNNPDPRVLPWIGRWDWSAAAEVARAALETEADVVHVQYQTGAFGMHPAVNLLPQLLRRAGRRVPVVTTFHDLLAPYLFPKAGPARQWANRALALGSRALIVTNELDRLALGRSPRLGRRTVLIPIGSNLPCITDADLLTGRAALGITDGERAIGFFGFLTANKGVDLLIEALEQLPGHRPRLVVVGGTLGETDVANGTYHHRIRERLEASSVPITATGYLPPDDASAALAVLDLIVLPFRHGASLRSGSLIAAVRSGAPVLTTDPSPGDSLAPLIAGESVWLVPPGDAASLARGIDLLLVDRALRERLRGAAGAATQAFSWNAIAERHADLYARVVGAHEAVSGAA
ncbi:MAG TPA: glycosyltransferase [Thermomicrobiaceae bacterium]|nr:glycosyltransferase [Thermomicrobiaceae bacterium]